MKHLLILISCFYCLLSQEESEIVYVEINQSDIDYLGGWPLDRKWYAIALDRLRQSGAKEVFIDLSFPNADAFHPESDQFFYHEINKASVFILNDQFNQTDSIQFLGHYKFPTSQTYKSLTDFDLKSNGLRIGDISGTIVSKWLGKDAFSHFYLDINGPFFKSSYRFIDIIKDSILNLSKKRVLLALNLNGYSSYIAGLGNEGLITSSELNLYVYQQLSNQQFYYKPTIIHYILQFFLLSSFLILRVQNRQKYDIPIIIASIIMPIFLFYMSYLLDWIILSIPAVIILISAYSSIQNKEEASDDPELKAEIQRLRKKLAYLESNSVTGERLINHETLKRVGIICHPSSPIVSLFEKAKIVAQSTIPVMIYGESGTGKEGLAQFIHSESERKSNSFIAINCGAISETLIESEIFGHEAGSFTGANKQKIGKFELANKGSIFLDEIAETSEAFQIKLLRVLQEGRFERLGGNESIQVSVRVITASHQDIANSDRFRKDLFYRLNGIQLKIPALKDRKVDIGPLTFHYLKQFDTNSDLQLTDQIVQWLEAQLWPGNVRQLMSSIERACINCKLAERKQFVPEDFEIDNVIEIEPELVDRTKSDQTADTILNLLRQKQFSHKSVSEVADLLSIHRITVTEYLRAWIIHFMNLENLDSEKIYHGIKGNIDIQKEEKFRQRIDKYIDSIRDKILSSKTSNYEIIQTELFKNLPASFHSDLETLIQKVRSQK